MASFTPAAVQAELIASVPLAVALFRWLGPRRATLVVVVAGYVFLPNMLYLTVPTPSPTGGLVLTRTGFIGLALAAGALLCGRRDLRVRPGWVDLPMAVFVAYPLSSLLTGWPGVGWDVLDIVTQRVLEWFLPYAAGRAYLGDERGPVDVAAAVVLAGLANVPVCLWEAALGPAWYVARLAYGWDRSGAVDRLGGWKPDGFFGHGVEHADWMAVTAVTAFWLWAGGAWKPRRGPSWWPTLVLVMTSVGMRGVYGYLTLAVGMAVAAVTLTLRTRAALVLLAAVVPAYAAVRLGDLADPAAVTRLAARVTGRESSIAFRFQAEDQIIDRLRETHSTALGTGGRFWNLELWGGPWEKWVDSWWTHLLWEGGVVGLSLHLLALHLVPAGVALSEPRGRPSRVDAGTAAWGLALVTLLIMATAVNNTNRVPLVGLIAGVLGSRAAVGRPRGPSPAAGGRARPAADAGHRPPRPAEPMPASVPAVVSVACLLYVFAHGPVPGQDTLKLVGGFGAALLFAAAGAVGAWAADRFTAGRLSAYAACFAALGISFNLALHPASRPIFSADILQGLAACGLAVALWRRWVSHGAPADALLTLAPLALHVLGRGRLPEFPGSQFLWSGPGEATGLSLFPLFPWLTVAAFGAWAARESTALTLTAGVAFAAGAAALWANPGGPRPPEKFPMNLTYAALSLATVAGGFALARGLNLVPPARAALRRLGGWWLIYFYIHFAVAQALAASGVGAPWAVWTLMALGSVAATWAVGLSLAPLAPWFRRPAPWAALGVLLLAAATVPASPPVVAGLAGACGLVFGAHYPSLAVVFAPVRRAAAPDDVGGGVGSGPVGAVVRLVAVLALLSAPEVLAWVVDRLVTPATVHDTRPGANPGTTSATTSPVGPGRPGR